MASLLATSQGICLLSSRVKVQHSTPSIQLTSGMFGTGFSVAQSLPLLPKLKLEPIVAMIVYCPLHLSHSLLTQEFLQNFNLGDAASNRCKVGARNHRVSIKAKNHRGVCGGWQGGGSPLRALSEVTNSCIRRPRLVKLPINFQLVE